MKPSLSLARAALHDKTMPRIHSFLTTLQTLITDLRNQRREVKLVIASAIMLVLVSSFSVFTTFKYAKSTAHLASLNAFSGKLSKFSRTLRVVESSQRGFLLTDRQDFLEGYQQNHATLAPILTELLQQAPENEGLRQSLLKIEPLLEAKVKEMSETVALTTQGNKQAAIAKVADGVGLALTEEIENQVAALRTKIADIFKQNVMTAERLKVIKSLVDITALVLLIGFSVMSVSTLASSNRSLQIAQDKLANVNKELEVTVARRTQALALANEELQRFAYIVSHDLRSPLVNVMGFTSELEVLRDDIFKQAEAETEAPSEDSAETSELKRQFDESLKFIRSSIERMDRLINAILRVSREGSRPIASTTLDLNTLFETIISGMAHQIREKEVDVTVGPLPPLKSDRLAIEQIFSNLIDNAIKYLKADVPGVVEITGRADAATNTYIIKDNGRGIDPRDHQRIFELFRRSGVQDVPGEGIGLANVAALVRKLGGTISLNSKVNEGSTFILTFPKDIVTQKAGNT